MKIEIIDGEEDELILNEDEVAHKDGKLYRVYNSKKTYAAGNCLGQFKFVIDEEKKEVLAQAYPLTSLSNGFELIKKDRLEYIQNLKWEIKEGQ